MNVQGIPQNGRIGRFAKIVKKNSDEASYLTILKDSEKYADYCPSDKAGWWSSAVERLESESGNVKAAEIMRSCGAKCCGAGQRKTARRLMRESKTIDEFLRKLGSYEVKEGELEYTLVDKQTIIAKHNRCFCGQVKNSNKQFANDTYCQCSVEFNKQFFQAALDKPVEVELDRSILNGGDCYEFEIRIFEY